MKMPSILPALLLAALGALGLGLSAAPAFALECESPYADAAERDAAREALSAQAVERVKHLEALARALRLKLGMRQDPFQGNTTLEQFTKTWHLINTAFPPLVEVRHAVFDAAEHAKPLDSSLEASIEHQAMEILDGSGGASPPKTVAGAMFAVLKLAEPHSRAILPPVASPAPPPPKAEEKKKEEPKPKKKPEDQPPRYPDMQDKYKAHNKDTDKSGGDSAKKVTLAWINKPGVRYFRIGVYVLLDAVSGAMSNHPLVSATRAGAASQYSVTVLPYDRVGEKLPLLIPQGFEPVTGVLPGGRVDRDAKEIYWFVTDQKELKVPLIEAGAAARPLSPQELEVYTSPTGARLTDWPDHLQDAVKLVQDERKKNLKANSGRYFGATGDAMLAKDLALYVAKNFLYRVDKSEYELGPVALARDNGDRRGAMQCDAAAVMLASILRETFKIPCRVMGGYRGEHSSARPGTSHVVAAGSAPEGHAWVEIADAAGVWHGVDPTPITPDRKKDQKPGEKDDFAQIPDPDATPEADDSPDAPDGSPKDGRKAEGSGAGKPMKDIMQETADAQAAFAKKHREDLEKKLEAAKQAKEESKKPEDKPDEAIEEMREIRKTDLDDYIARLKGGFQPAVEFAVRQLIAWSVDPAVGSDTKLKRLQLLGADIGRLEEHYKNLIGPIVIEAKLVFAGKHPPLAEWITSIIGQAPKRPLNDTVREISQVQRQLEFTVKLLDPVDQGAWRPTLAALHRLRSQLNTIRHKDSQRIRIAEEMFENLPGNNSRRDLTERYGLGGSLGPDLGTARLADAINAGKLNSFRLASILGPHTDFVVDPIENPAWSYNKTWMQDPASPRRNDFIRGQDPRTLGELRLRRAFKLDPHLSDEEAWATGQAYKLARRKRVKIPEGTTSTDPEKATVLLFDTSGSMDGKPAIFQSNYIAALVDKALSDLGPSGRTRHRVYLIGFGDHAATPIEITTPQQAQDLVRNAEQMTGNNGQGTNIQGALIAAADLLEKANSTGDRALSRATVVLCSDGGSEIDAGKIRKAFDKIDNKRATKMDLLLAFVAINGTNEKLIELTEKGTMLGAEKSMYVEWGTQMIEKMIADSEAKPEVLNDFWSDLSYSALSPTIRGAFDDVRNSTQGIERARAASRTGNPEYTLDQGRAFTRATGLNVSEEERPHTHSATLRRLRKLLNAVGPTMSAGERRRLVEELLARWSRYFAGSWSEYDEPERQNMKLLFNDWVANGQSGSKM
jgi:uncharacterized protein YegL